MKQLRLVLLLSVLLLALPVLAGCGGGGDGVSENSIAQVGDSQIPKAEFDALIDQARASYKAQKRDFPKAGTPEYNTLKTQAVQFLVQRAQFEQKAAELEVEVSDADVEKRLKEIKKQYFGGSEKKYKEQLQQQQLSEQQVKKDIRALLVQEGLYKQVTKDVQVTAKEIRAYYDKNKDQYGQPESREVRHILVPSKKLAEQLYAQLKAGGDFAALAKKHSKDPGSAAQGGKLTVAKGATVPAFDKLAFQLKKGELAQPVKTQYGWHVIEALSAIKPAKTTPFKQVQESIKQQLVQTEKNERMTKWVEDVKKEFADDTEYQVGFAPPTTAATTAAE
jgi:foldase protein PrsA